MLSFIYFRLNQHKISIIWYYTLSNHVSSQISEHYIAWESAYRPKFVYALPKLIYFLGLQSLHIFICYPHLSFTELLDFAWIHRVKHTFHSKKESSQVVNKFRRICLGDRRANLKISISHNYFLLRISLLTCYRHKIRILLLCIFRIALLLGLLIIHILVVSIFISRLVHWRLF